MHGPAVEYCRRCGARADSIVRPEPFDPRFCWRCFDGEAGAVRALELIAGAAEGRWAAMRMLDGVSDARALDTLIDALDHDSSDVRRAVLGSIGLIGDSSAAAAVADRLGDPENRVRRAAVTALAEMGGEDATSALVAALDDPELGVEAATALAWLEDARAFPALIGAIGRPSRARNMSRTPLAALTWLGERRAIPHLIRRLGELESAFVAGDGPNWAALRDAEEVARVLLYFGGPEVEAAVAHASEVFPYLNLHIPVDWTPPPPQFPSAAEERADPTRTVPKWSLELVEEDAPVTEPVTKFGGQPTWVAEPTWPLTRDETPMTFFGQFAVPTRRGGWRTCSLTRRTTRTDGPCRAATPSWHSPG